MDLRTIGATGIKVSPICLGSMMFGPWGNPDREECVRMIHTALDGGINFIDTADVYGAGESERIVGEALAEAGAGRRDDVVLATKFHGHMGDDPNRGGSSRRWIIRACEESLRRLQTDWIDLYQAHRPDRTCDVDETLSALSDLVHQGKVRAIGSSTFPAQDIVEAQWVAERRGRERFRCEQPPYSILVRAVEAAVLPTCQKYGMGVIAWAPLARGWLTGKYRRGQEPPPGSRMTRGRMTELFSLDRPENQAKLDAVEELMKVASDAGRPLAHLAVAWVLNHPAVTAAIVGPRIPEQVEDLVAMANEDLRLDESILDRIDEIVPPGRNVNPADGGYTSPAVADARLRRRGPGRHLNTQVAGFLLPPEPVTSVDAWRALGGGEGLSLARAKGSDWIIEELTRSGLRGRGGGGFRTGRKWAGVKAQPGSHHYVVCNAAEGEPATFKDRALLRANPYQLVEGVAIAAFALDARHAYIGFKASFEWEVLALESAIAEMAEAGLAGDVPITIVPGPDEYLFGEEKAMLEVIEGRPPMPRLLPPYEHGLFAMAPQMGWEGAGPEPGHLERDESNPTLVNNCETLCNVPHILAWGAEWFRGMGTEESPGTIVATVVGDVARPGYAEVEMGTPLRQVIDEVGGGARPGRTIKAVFSGVANAVLTADRLDTPLSYEAMAAAGSGLGAAGYAVYDDTACMVAVAHEISKFLYVESCGQCPPCKLNSEQITDRLAAIDGCRGGDDDIAAIGARLLKVTDGNRCYLPVEEQIVVGSIMRAFPEEFAAHVEGDCPRHRPDLAVPKIVDLQDGKVVYDEKQGRKRPDWTYS